MEDGDPSVNYVYRKHTMYFYLSVSCAAVIILMTGKKREVVSQVFFLVFLI